MGSRRTLLLVVAIGLAALATVGSFLYLQSVKEDADKEIAAVEVYVVKNPVNRGDQADIAIANGSFVQEKVARRNVPDDAIYDLGALKGKVAAGDLSPKQVLTDANFDDPSNVASTGAQRLSEPNLVLVTLPISGVQAVGGNVMPGDKVNLVVIGKPLDDEGAEVPNAENRSVATVMYQKAQVVYVGTNAAPEPGEAASEDAAVVGGSDITFAVPQDAANRLIRWSSGNNNIWLTLVRDDYTPTPYQPIGLENQFDTKLTPYE